MRLQTILITMMTVITALTSCQRSAKLELRLPSRYDGKQVELISYMDSSVVATSVVRDGVAMIETSEGDSLRFPVFMQVVVDGRTRAYYVAEEGEAVMNDSSSYITGTPMNDLLAGLMSQLDSIEDTDDMNAYIEFAEKQYNANIDNPIGAYFGVEWMKFAEPASIDSMLSKASPEFRDSRRVKMYEKMAKHRLATSPGVKYIDFEGEDSRGHALKLSQLMVKGKYTIIDFWASWCLYCIKELPELKRLRSELGEKVEIIGVAVRDIPNDTRAMVKKQEIGWPVLYNTGRLPYNIYGFTGIPHHILVDPDGVIVSRGESAAQLYERILQIENK